jgi:hypothetical protein
MVERKPRIAAMVCGVAFAVAGGLIGGCATPGAAAPAKAPASVSGGASASATPGPPASASFDAITEYVADARAYVRCMRKNGVKLPDPAADGTIDYSGINRVDPDATLRGATRKCASLLPVAPGGSLGGGRPVQ